jgi:pimeloyl-ACP methyl ester carboxylesterase
MINRPDRTNILKNSTVPVLFVIGSEDVAAPLDDLLKQVHLPKISFIHILDNVGHMSMWEKPQELNNYLLQFIESELTPA